MLAQKETITLTDGNIHNNYLRIRQLNGLMGEVASWPDAEIVLDLQGVGQVKTEVDKNKGIFLEREAVRRFFQTHGLKAGDEIAVEKVSDRHIQIAVERKSRSDTPAQLSCHDGVEPEDAPDNQLSLFEAKQRQKSHKRATRIENKRANDLDGREWTSHSISIWRDIRKTVVEKYFDYMPTSGLVQRQVLLLPWRFPGRAGQDIPYEIKAT
jgi:antitoxin component of MazEF toxin-antitoxin module